ncbi:hypothetical protein ACJJI5_06955 [Microbulbifer sp. EKSA008]|uniref:hypothetical protein n=2 Tax=Microbulbifer TaxID=48073 RepID=UPI0024AD63D5|nr:hypothetical protein [Microbulbifer sp. VAAF005]WHI48248.1 hypothetical protein P0078_07700 [Microbulbifer sp. VAAF005]
MNVVRLSFLLIVLMVFQTAGAFYDSHEEVQEVTNHLSLHHDEDLPGNLPFQPDSSPSDLSLQIPSSGDEADQSSFLLDLCNHCCHCHGSTFTALVGQSLLSILSGIVNYREFGNTRVPSGYFTPLLRPPITQV